jgi:hypothetical protein
MLRPMTEGRLRENWLPKGLLRFPRIRLLLTYCMSGVTLGIKIAGEFYTSISRSDDASVALLRTSSWSGRLWDRRSREFNFYKKSRIRC